MRRDHERKYRYLKGKSGGGDRSRHMIIPYEKLSGEALTGLIEEFVSRHGTDTGYTKNTLEQNVDMVKRQLKRGDARIVYDPSTRTANIVPKGKLNNP